MSGRQPREMHGISHALAAASESLITRAREEAEPSAPPKPARSPKPPPVSARSAVSSAASKRRGGRAPAPVRREEVDELDESDLDLIRHIIQNERKKR